MPLVVNRTIEQLLETVEIQALLDNHRELESRISAIDHIPLAWCTRKVKWEDQQAAQQCVVVVVCVCVCMPRQVLLLLLLLLCLQ